MGRVGCFISSNGGEKKLLEINIGSVYPCTVIGRGSLNYRVGNISGACSGDKSKVKAINKIIACIG